MRFNISGKFLALVCAFAFLLCSVEAFADSFDDGIAAYKASNYTFAETCFRKALKAQPNDDMIKYYLAISLVQNKKNNEAKGLYRDIIASSQSDHLVNYAKQGLSMLKGEGRGAYGVSKAILNVNTSGSLLLVNNVNVNDRAKVQFIFDTGATFTTISSKLAKTLGISTANAQKVKIMTGSGYINAPKITLDKVEVNGLIVYNVEALVADLPLHASGKAGDLAGLLGLSFMKDFKVTVDRPNHQIILER